MPHSRPRFPFAAALLAAAVVLSFPGKPLDAGVLGSPHDFSSYTGVAASGSCSACHIPHDADQEAMWIRSLADYRTKLTANGGGTSQINYVHSPTIPCYDCHDTHTSGNIDDNPLKSSFSSQYPPQDIAFGGNGPGGKPGYYENNPPYPPGGPFTTSFGANRNLNPGDCVALLTTGGHYLSQNYNGSGSFRVGDKLPCSDCHEPHTWDSSRQAFIRIGLPTSGANGVDSLDTTVQASLYMTYQTGHGTRSNLESRKICARCHGYSLNNGTPVTYNSINAAYNDSTRIPRPPDNVQGGGPSIPEHQYTTNSGAAACVSCHKHNSIVASCTACHSYPGLDNTISLKQMSRGHWPHVGRPGAGGMANSMGYACDVCHYNVSTRHNGSNDFTGTWWTYVDVQFNPALNPAFTGGGPTYGGQNAYGGSYAPGIGVADGNTGNNICAGLFCHGDNPDRNRLAWEGAAKQPEWDNTAGGGACGDCHRAGSNLRQGSHAVHIDNTGANARGPGGITAFSPAGNCSDGTATGCHTVYGKTPTTTHAGGTATFRTSPSNGAATDNNGTQVCNACHSTYAVPYFDNALFVSNAKSGALLAKEGWKDNTSRLPCLTCHNNNGQTAGSTANTKMDGSGAWAPGIEKYWRSSGHGYPSGAPVDNASTNTVSGNVKQTLPIPCRYCHAVDSRHFGNTTTGNAWRLASWSGYDNTATGGLDKFCATYCHGTGSWLGTWQINKPDVPQDHYWNVGATEVKGTESTDTHPTARDVYSPDGCSGLGCTIIPPSASDKMPLGSEIFTGGGNDFLCVTCHDPHGTGPDPAANWGRSFAGSNSTSPVDNVHMLRYEYRDDLCRKCHVR